MKGSNGSNTPSFVHFLIFHAITNTLKDPTKLTVGNTIPRFVFHFFEILFLFWFACVYTMNTPTFVIFAALLCLASASQYCVFSSNYRVCPHSSWNPLSTLPLGWTNPEMLGDRPVHLRVLWLRRHEGRGRTSPAFDWSRGRRCLCGGPRFGELPERRLQGLKHRREECMPSSWFSIVDRLRVCREDNSLLLLWWRLAGRPTASHRQAGHDVYSVRNRIASFLQPWDP